METERLRYFAACNSEDGFRSFYNEVFTDDLTHIYIIKGGPGTGKSSLMRRAADRAEEKGYYVEEVYCSSDPSSLDGILAYDPKGENHFAILDGTAPHVVEMELPGARDEILYVGQFWSSEALRRQRDEITQIGQARRESYRRLYRYLQAAGQCVRNMASLTGEYLDREKLRKTVFRILSRYPVGEKFSQKTMLTSSIGMKGLVKFQTFEDASDLVFRVYDCGHSAYRLFDEILRAAQERRMRVWVSYDPLIPAQIDGICLPDHRLSFVQSDRAPMESGEEKTVRRLSMSRYLNTEGYHAVVEALDIAQKGRDRMMAAALEILSEIRKLHFELESRYVSAMDFDAMRGQVTRWLDQIIP